MQNNKHKGNKHEICFANPKKYGTHKAVKYADTNVGKGEGFITYPLYALGFLKKEEEHLIIPFPSSEFPDDINKITQSNES